MKKDKRKPEPLEGKNMLIMSCGKTKQEWVKKELIKSAVEWYKIYFNNPQSLLKDYPAMRDEMYPQLKSNTYNNWLINKAFEDVM